MNHTEREKRAARRRQKTGSPGEASRVRGSWSRARRFGVLIAILCLLFWYRAAWWPALMHQTAARALTNHDPETALVWLNRVGWLVDRDSETEILKAGAYRRQGEMEKCAAALRLAHELGADVNRLQREQILAQAQSGQMRAAVPHLSRLLRDRTRDPAEVCEAYVIGYLRTQRHAEALELLNAWIADDEDDPLPYLQRGQIRRLRRETGLAEADVRRAIELAPDNAAANVELGEILLGQNRMDEAVPFLERALADSKQKVNASIALAKCLKADGRNARAMRLLNSAVEAEPQHAVAQRELGRGYVEEGSYEAAVPVLETAVKLAPRDDESHYLLAQALSLSGRVDDAEPHFAFFNKAGEAHTELDRLNDALMKNPRDVVALVRAGELLLVYANPNEGVVRLLAALDLQADQPKALRLLADHYRERAATDSAFEDLAEDFGQRAKAVESP